jgi:ATP-dependent helicase HrpB
MPAIVAALDAGPRLVVTAPPGAGKTTRIPLALLDRPWAQAGRILLVEPRRIAARAAAQRMAATLGEQVGDAVGVRSRMDVRVSAKTRIEVITEGVFTRMILSDPALEGVSAVLFDEFHERSLDADAGLAFALDAQDVLRGDLRLVVMSATLPPAMTSGFFDAPVIASAGRMFPVETVYLGGSIRERIEPQMAAAIHRALKEEEGSILAFLPGAAEIERTAAQLRVDETIDVAPLYGALGRKQQDLAISPSPPGRRKVVLATDIAESALTIEGVRVVIDGGLSRIPRHDPGLGATRLETVRVSVASADQRRGRAGRTAPGVCYRLWREAEMGGFAAHGAAEIETSDLTGFRLDAARWGVTDPDRMRLLSGPPKASWQGASDMLASAGALSGDGALTPMGAKLSELPLSPRLGLMLLKAADIGAESLAAEVAALLSERDLGGRSTDAEERLKRLREARGEREAQMLKQARRWSSLATSGVKPSRAYSIGEVLALGFPERIAKARGGAPGRFQLAGGRGGFVDETDAFAREDWLVAADVTGGGADVRITLAARISQASALAFGGAATTDDAKYDAASGSVRARRITRLHSIIVADTPLPLPPRELVERALLDGVSERFFVLSKTNTLIAPLLDRVRYLAEVIGPPWPLAFPETLKSTIEEWAPPLLSGKTRIEQIGERELVQALLHQLDWPLQQQLGVLAPTTWTTPAGSHADIDYAAAGGPTVTCRVQEVLGLRQHPTVGGGRTSLVLQLVSPALRPVAVTRDIESFWDGGYADMRKDMRARYPKHDWPEDPRSALARTRSLKAKPESH